MMDLRENWHCGKMTDVSDLIDDLVQDTSDRFIVDDKGNFKSKIHKTIWRSSQVRRAKSNDLVTALYDRDTNIHLTPRNAQIKFAQEPSVEIYMNTTNLWGRPVQEQ
jgi:hypothetical protein